MREKGHVPKESRLRSATHECLPLGPPRPVGACARLEAGLMRGGGERRLRPRLPSISALSGLEGGGQAGASASTLLE